MGATGSAGGAGQSESIGGVWNGADTSGRSFVGLADEAGEFHLIRDDGTQFVGTATIKGDAVSAKAERLLRPGGPEGSKAEEVSVKGKVQQRQSMSVTVTPVVPGQSQARETISLQFNPSYNGPSSVAMFVGHYMDLSSGNSITVTGSGSIFWHDPNTGCLANGAVSVIDPSHNLYFVQFSYAGCQGVDAELNGVEFRGLGTLDTSRKPAQAIIAVTGEAGTLDTAHQSPQAIIGVTREAGARGYAIDLKLSKLPPPSPI